MSSTWGTLSAVSSYKVTRYADKSSCNDLLTGFPCLQVNSGRYSSPWSGAKSQSDTSLVPIKINTYATSYSQHLPTQPKAHIDRLVGITLKILLQRWQSLERLIESLPAGTIP